MLLGARRMAQPCGGRLRPIDQALVALGGRGFDAVRQPAVELLGRRAEAGIAVATHVVKAHAAADDQHAFVAQRRQRAAGFQVGPRIQVMAQRQLNHRDIRLREHQLQRNEQAMVEAALRIHPGGLAALVEQRGHPLGQRRLAGSRVAQLVGVRRKAVIVVDQLGAGRTGHAERRFQPVRRDHDDGARPLGQRVGHAAQVLGHAVPRGRRVPVHEEAGAGAVGDEQRRLAKGCGSAHGRAPEEWLCRQYR